MYWVVMAVVAIMIPLGKYEPQSIHTSFGDAVPQRGPPACDFSWTLECERAVDNREVQGLENWRSRRIGELFWVFG